MYQALVRLPSQLHVEAQAENGAEPPHARFDWRALLRALMRLFSPRR